MRGDTCGEVDTCAGVEPSIGDVLGDDGDVFEPGWAPVPPGTAKLTRPREKPARGRTCARARAASALPAAPDFQGAITASGSMSLALARARGEFDPGSPVTVIARALAFASGAAEVEGRRGVKDDDSGEPGDGDSLASL